MAKVHFFYSTMNAGKSTALLQSAHNYHETGNETILFIPREDADKNLGLIKSRIGLSASAVVIDSKLKNCRISSVNCSFCREKKGFYGEKRVYILRKLFT